MSQDVARPGVALAVLITTLVALGPLSTDFYLPSLPALTEALGTDVAGAQMTLSVFLVGFAVGQLFYGPLSDRFGRRPALLAGLFIYLLGSLGCTFAADIEWLIAARFAQALGACAGPVLGRAIVRDLYGPHDAARMLSYVGAAMALAPLLGPLLGGWLSVWFDWRACFVFLSLYSAALLLASGWMLGESNHHRDRDATRPGHIVANYRSLLADRHYLGVLLCNGLAYAALFSFISASSFVFIGLFGFSPQAMGLAFGAMVSGYIVGSTGSGRLGARFGSERLLGAGALTGTVAGAAMLGLALAGVEQPLAVMIPMWFAACAIGVVMPNAVALGLAPYPRMAGAAASLMGFSQMGLAALAGLWVGHSFSGSVLPMAALIAGGMAGSLLAWLLWVRGKRAAVA
ncbi:MAG: multidrug effflux MFS transporter [Rhodocyclaceae bacterium]|nr:multidrug effflux MFS transporter [Rhodocyclaceae bacterium]MCP5232637.1 multidrug effflux MFS transporter [Zoogloeaceae bacterium]MCB1911718.1 multidrug effflux MFS transporter [Rhodocyclaceae bacterium]MCP5240669.1 multidrug effflux MFS transporter [Zoogloeaceae bacterium]MCP5253218.1 multidrug effflux MFS transporter [Zoogloeaceae bacterium]